MAVPWPPVMWAATEGCSHEHGHGGSLSACPGLGQTHPARALTTPQATCLRMLRREQERQK